MDQTCRRQLQPNCIVDLKKLDMVHKELTCQILVQLRKMLREQ
jgi:hypothetical protein